MKTLMCHIRGSALKVHLRCMLVRIQLRNHRSAFLFALEQTLCKTDFNVFDWIQLEALNGTKTFLLFDFSVFSCRSQPTCA